MHVLAPSWLCIPHGPVPVPVRGGPLGREIGRSMCGMVVEGLNGVPWVWTRRTAGPEVAIFAGRCAVHGTTFVLLTACLAWTRTQPATPDPKGTRHGPLGVISAESWTSLPAVLPSCPLSGVFGTCVRPSPNPVRNRY